MSDINNHEKIKAFFGDRKCRSLVYIVNIMFKNPQNYILKNKIKPNI